MRKKTIVGLRSLCWLWSRRSPSLPPILLRLHHHPPPSSSSPSSGFKPSPSFSHCSSSATLRFLNTSSFDHQQQHDSFQDEISEEEETKDGWEEEEDATDPEVGDGGDGGGVVFNDVPWGERALSIALEVLPRFGDDMKLFSFKTTRKGYIYMRLDKLSNEYGCPSMDELEMYSKEYTIRLDEAGALGEMPDDLAVEVSSPGAERLLRVPDDLDRFKEMPMRVCYQEDDVDCEHLDKNGVFLLESIETESCIWKLADVKENRDPRSKGRPLSRKQKDWRLELPFVMHKKVSLYLEY